jgi:nucleoside-diphosphate-sugar epimerase
MGNIYGVHGSHIFITGGAGFIATTLASRLVEDNRVTLYDNLHNNALQYSPLQNHPNVEFIRGDVLDVGQLSSAIAPTVDYVIHCAAIAGVDTVVKNPLKTLEVNLLGTFHVLSACARQKGLKRFVDFSTSEIYGRRAYNVSEECINPFIRIGEARWTYSISKLAGEFIAHSYFQTHGVPVVSVRPFNVYGPNQVGVGAIHGFVVRALKGDDLFVHNDGMQIRSWAYIDDFVHGVLLAMTHPKSAGKSYNIGNPRASLTILALARMVTSLAGSTSRLIFKKLDYEDVELRIPDITAARSDLGFEPTVDIEEGLQRTIAWYRARQAPDATRRAA